jgi:mono/diheme cytochrome c family protein
MIGKAMALALALAGGALVAASLAWAQSAPNQRAAAPPAQKAEPPPPEASVNDIDGETMFATSCGFCHQDGGKAAGKGPKLAASKRSDEYLIERIKKGKPGAMPAFGKAFSEGQIIAIVAYIRTLDE